MIQGDTAGDRAGWSVASAGDVNGDGIDDVIVGAPLGDDGGTNAGEAYVVFGKADSFRAPIDLSTLGGTDGFVLRGGADGDQAGWSVDTAGDVNGDGIADLLVGAPTSAGAAGQTYVVFGKLGATRADLDLASLAAADGIAITGAAATDLSGYSVSAAGDVNGDGLDDLIVGARYGDTGGLNAGDAYVIFGRTGATWTDLDLGSLDPVDGFRIQGDAAGDQAGRSVSAAGDVNGDGIDDLVIGATESDSGGTNAGQAYVVFGKTGATRATIDLASLAASDGFSIKGDANYDRAGFSVAAVGDVNGDGIDDLAVGAPYGDKGGDRAGQAYVIFGKDADTRSGIDLASLADADGFVIEGSQIQGFVGVSVSAAGDVNGDGFADMIVGSYRADNGGEAYVIFGQDADTRADIDLSNLAEADGFTVLGDETGDRAGRSVSAAGDVNGDGVADLIVGARRGDDGGTDAGEAYVIYGIDPFAGELRTYLGTVDADVFVATGNPNDRWLANGRNASDQITTANGDDTIIGGWGNDTINAGGGDDLIQIDLAGRPGDRNTIDGGAGFDEIRPLKDNAPIGLRSLANVERINADGFAGITIALTTTADQFDFTDVELIGITAIRGGGGNDTIVGSQGDDTILGEAGNDSLGGGDGNDSFRVLGDVRNDRFDGGDGIDSIVATADNTRIGATSFTAIETIDGGGFANVGLVASNGADLIDLSAVTLIGIASIDSGAGNDIVIGSAGDDVIEGAGGADTLTGGLGADIFDYDLVFHSGPTSADLITDFEVGTDLIDLADIDANAKIAGNDAFAFIGEIGFTKVAGQLRLDTSVAGLTTIEGDINGDGKADFVIRLDGELTLTDADFLL